MPAGQLVLLTAYELEQGNCEGTAVSTTPKKELKKFKKGLDK